QVRPLFLVDRVLPSRRSLRVARARLLEVALDHEVTVDELTVRANRGVPPVTRVYAVAVQVAARFHSEPCPPAHALTHESVVVVMRLVDGGAEGSPGRVGEGFRAWLAAAT